MRKVIAIFLIATGVVAAFGVMLAWPRRPPVELRLVSSKFLDGSLNGKKFKQLTLSMRNRSGVSIYCNPVDDVQVRIQGEWIDVALALDQAEVGAGQTTQKRLYVPERAEACRLRFSYYIDYQQPSTWMSRSVAKLGPKAVRIVENSPSLRELTGRLEPGYKELTVEVEIPL